MKNSNFLFLLTGIFCCVNNYSQNFHGNWTNIGPIKVPDGQGNATGLGRINVIKFHPEYDGDTNEIIYCGASNGGLWKTTDDGESWSNVQTDNLPTLGVSDIAMFKYSGQDHIYLATGDRDINARPGPHQRYPVSPEL